MVEKSPAERYHSFEVISPRRRESEVVRTVISVTDDDKAWLDRRAHEEGTTMTEVVRRAVRFYRSVCDPEDADFASLLDRTAGTWRQGDGLEYQRRVRAEWES
jgi:hypothetical protein